MIARWLLCGLFVLQQTVFHITKMASLFPFDTKLIRKRVSNIFAFLPGGRNINYLATFLSFPHALLLLGVGILMPTSEILELASLASWNAWQAAGVLYFFNFSPLLSQFLAPLSPSLVHERVRNSSDLLHNAAYHIEYFAAVKW